MARPVFAPSPTLPVKGEGEVERGDRGSAFLKALSLWGRVGRGTGGNRHLSHSSFPQRPQPGPYAGRLSPRLRGGDECFDAVELSGSDA